MRLTLSFQRNTMRLKEPFRISGYLFETVGAVTVRLSDGRSTGRGEAAGVYYLGDDADHMESEVGRVRAAVEEGVSRMELRGLLGPGGARNALDCALWELESLTTGTPVAALAGLASVRPLVTTFTIPAVPPGEIEHRLAPLAAARALKLKLEGDFEPDADRLHEVRRLRPDTWLSVDANQGFSARDLDDLGSLLVETRVAVLEQPVRRDHEHELDGWRSPVPIAADESILSLEELHARHDRFDIINVKLDKCGGLTEALLMADAVKALGKDLMVGNMAGSSIATAAGFVVGQVSQVVDLDGTYFLADSADGAELYHNGLLNLSAGVWGAAESRSAARGPATSSP